MAILISIHPKWVNKILSGEKTVEIRKTMPKCKLPTKVYIYQTKAKERLVEVIKKGDILYGDEIYNEDKPLFIKNFGIHHFDKGNGKIVAEFTLNTIEVLWQNHKDKSSTAMVVDKEIFEKLTCMTWQQYSEYHKCKNGKYPNSYAWHIEDLRVYKEPKLLQNFFKPCGKCDKLNTNRCTEELSPCNAKVITRPPQSWCYCQKVE